MRFDLRDNVERESEGVIRRAGAGRLREALPLLDILPRDAVFSPKRLKRTNTAKSGKKLFYISGLFSHKDV